MSKIHSLTIGLLLCATLFAPLHAADSSRTKVNMGIAVEHVKVLNGSYEVFPQEKFAFEFCTKRPATADNNIVLCIPAAFTRHDNKIDGVFVANGAVDNATAINRELGGAMSIKSGHCKLLDTNKGALLSPEFLESLKKDNVSLFQQFLLVHNGTPATFRDQSKFQRRAIGLTKQGAYKIFQSDKAISFSTFNSNLVSMGVTEALYFDMGAWDEGWYRHATTGKTISIGLDRSRTDRQSNWLILKKP